MAVACDVVGRDAAGTHGRCARCSTGPYRIGAPYDPAVRDIL